MKVGPAPGPDRYDRVWVQQLGPRAHDRVVVLMPGTNGGAGSISPVARDIVKRVARTQVWIVDRRQQAFEDTAVFERRDPQAALDHYLGFEYRRVLGSDARFAAEWGLRVQLADLRRVVRHGTDLSNGRVARGARRLARFSRITRPVVVDDECASHLDPTAAAPARNRFLKTVAPFLRRIRSR
jgi:hypothetical protein